jgi:repressor of nif and glnA expression
MFEEAAGFSSTEMELLRIIEQGPDRMSLAEIRVQIAESDAIQDELADTTIQYYLKNLREKELVTHNHNQYTSAVQ